MGAHVSACYCVTRARPRDSMHQFRLNITCGKHARDVEECGGDIAALQAQATLTLRQAAGMGFNRIMVRAAVVISCFARAPPFDTAVRWGARRGAYRAACHVPSACASPWLRCRHQARYFAAPYCSPARRAARA